MLSFRHKKQTSKNVADTTSMTTQLQQGPEHDIFQKALFCTLKSSMNLGLNTVPITLGQYLGQVKLIFCLV